MVQLRILLPTLLLTFGLNAQAYYLHQATGDILKKDEYRVGVTPQFIVDPDSDFNLSAYADMGFNRDFNLRAVLGFGDNFHTGIFANYVPVPDVEGQPAIGVLGGVMIARPGADLTEVSFRAHPFASKKFETEIGVFDAYGALPIGLRFLDGDTDLPAQLTFGTNWLTYNFQNVMFNAELGIDVSESFSYIAIGVVISLDEQQDFKVQPQRVRFGQ